MKVRLHHRIRQLVSRRPMTILVGLLALGVTISVWISPKLAVPISTGAAVLGAAVPAVRPTRPRPPVHDKDSPDDLANAQPVEQQ
ncbi:hypothetical protein [Streptomyces griseosporeus]|uniref:hypothetical protein n=1 Tax=Streptomyces griseosporeus TaxID=1910 RepID=UPI0037A585A3